MPVRPALFFSALIWIFLFSLQIPFNTSAQTTKKDQPVGIFISQEIRPFIEMVKGLEENLKIPSYRIFMDDNGRPYSTDPRFKGLTPQAFRAMVAVGPRALYYLVNHGWSGPLVYAMVLDPKTILGSDNHSCGVSLNLPCWGQFFAIHRTFPDIRRIGILFDPENNQDWFNHARAVAGLQGIRLIPLLVRQSSDIRQIFKKRDLGLDAIMFIPDRTVISRVVVEYVIKEALLRGVPSIGYNRFFHDSGAVLSFVIDYQTVGKQVASQVERILDGRPCARLVPNYKVVVNVRVAKKLGLRWGKNLPKRLEKD